MSTDIEVIVEHAPLTSKRRPDFAADTKMRGKWAKVIDDKASDPVKTHTWTHNRTDRQTKIHKVCAATGHGGEVMIYGQ